MTDFVLRCSRRYFLTLGTMDDVWACVVETPLPDLEEVIALGPSPQTLWTVEYGEMRRPPRRLLRARFYTYPVDSGEPVVSVWFWTLSRAEVEGVDLKSGRVYRAMDLDPKLDWKVKGYHTEWEAYDGDPLRVEVERR